MKQAEYDEEMQEKEASSRSIAKHWAELVYRRIEGESKRVGEGVGGGGDAETRCS